MRRLVAVLDAATPDSATSDCQLANVPSA